MPASSAAAAAAAVAAEASAANTDREQKRVQALHQRDQSSDQQSYGYTVGSFSTFFVSSEAEVQHPLPRNHHFTTAAVPPPASSTPSLLAYATFLRLHVLYILLLSVLGATVLYFVESLTEQPVSYLDAFFTAASATSVTGLIVLDTAALTTASQAVIMTLCLLGGVVLTSVLPVLVRRRYFRRTVLRVVATEEEQQRILAEEAVEYRALGYIRNLVLGYWLFVQALIATLLFLAVRADEQVSALLAARGISPAWWAVFHTVTSFANAGFSVFTDNLIPVAHSAAVLGTLSISIMLGNTMAPVALRLAVFTLHRLRPEDEAWKLLLDRPRKCYTFMFSSSQTMVLGITGVLLLLSELLVFLGLSFTKPFLAAFSAPQRVMVGYFQAVSTRHAGFNAIDMSLVSPGLQVVYAWLMYLAAHPILVAIQRSTDAEAAARQAAKQAAALARRDAEADAVLALSAAERTSEATVLDPSGVETDNEEPVPRDDARAAHRLPVSRHDSLVVFTDLGSIAESAHEGGDADTVSGDSMVQDAARSPQQQPQQQPSRSISLAEKSVASAAPHTGVHARAASAIDMPAFQAPAGAGATPSVFQQMIKLAARDLPFLLAVVLLICLADDSSMQADNTHRFSIWPVIFEVVSAFGTVGLSLGYENSPLSLSALMSPFSKLLMIVVMIAGRHRGLPKSIDPAVYLPALLNRPIVGRRPEPQPQAQEPSTAAAAPGTTAAAAGTGLLPHAEAVTDALRTVGRRVLRSADSYAEPPRF